MSMIGNFFRTDENTVRKIKNGEMSLAELIYENDDLDESLWIDIDKTWHAIDFTLLGNAREKKSKFASLLRGSKNDKEQPENILSKVVLNGDFINDEDVGYGPAMLVSSKDVHLVNEAIKNIDREQFRKMFSMSRMVKEKIYPLIREEDEDEFFEYVFPYFESVKEFYENASKENQCVLFFIN